MLCIHKPFVTFQIQQQYFNTIAYCSTAISICSMQSFFLPNKCVKYSLSYGFPISSVGFIFSNRSIFLNIYNCISMDLQHVYMGCHILFSCNEWMLWCSNVRFSSRKREEYFINNEHVKFKDFFVLLVLKWIWNADCKTRKYRMLAPSHTHIYACTSNCLTMNFFKTYRIQ